MFYKPLFLLAPVFLLMSCGSPENPVQDNNDEIVDEVIEEALADAETPDSRFMKQLFELEEHVGWEAVDSSWRDRRMAWGEEYFETTQPAEMGSALLEFESVVLWTAVDKAWTTRREAWIKEVSSSTAESSLLDLLVEFETYILWEAVDPAWKQVRDGWIAECLAGNS